MFASEDLAKTGLSVLEDTLDIALHEDAMDEFASGEGGERDRVPYAVSDEGSAFALLEEMFMVPEGVRSADLFVHEAEGRFPCTDQGSPTDGEAVEAESVVDECAGMHLDGLRREDAEVQEIWRDTLEIRGVREEREHLLAGAWDPELGFKRVGFHR